MKRAIQSKVGPLIGLAFLLYACVISSPVCAFGADIPDYATLTTQAAATTGDTTLKLVSSMSGTTQLTIGRTLTLDLNGYDLTITIPDPSGSPVNLSGILIGSGTQLTLIDSSGSGKLTVTNNVNATLVGGSAAINTASGSLVIQSGWVEATSRSSAGIGGGLSQSGGTITISGGTVVAQGGLSSAGIGGGYYGSGGSITILGGTVDATGGNLAAGIGGGRQGTGGTILISGGSVTASGSMYYGAGIGGGYEGAAGSITITGGTVTAQGADGGAGIGGGMNGAGGTILISGGTVSALGGKATSSDYGAGAGIGSGGGRTNQTVPGSGNVTISGTVILTAVGGDARNTSGGGAGVGTGGTGSATGSPGAIGSTTIGSSGELIIIGGKGLNRRNGAAYGRGGDTFGFVSTVTPTGSGAPTSGQIVITFSEPMNPSVVGSVRVNLPPVSLTGGVWSSGNTVYTVAYSGLPYGKLNVVSIAMFATATGTTMPTDGSFTFTTMDAPLTSPLTYENLRGATNPNPDSYTEGVGLPALAPPGALPSLMFVGWYDALSGGNRIDSIGAGSTGPVTLYARWAQTSIQIDGMYKYIEGPYNGGGKTFTFSAIQVTDLGSDNSSGNPPLSGVSSVTLAGGSAPFSITINDLDATAAPYYFKITEDQNPTKDGWTYNTTNNTYWVEVDFSDLDANGVLVAHLSGSQGSHDFTNRFIAPPPQKPETPDTGDVMGGVLGRISLMLVIACATLAVAAVTRTRPQENNR